MGYNLNFATAFKYGLMFGKEVKPGQPVSMSVQNTDDILLAVKKAYIDMSPRTFKSVDKTKTALNPQKKESLFRELAERFFDYMKNGADDFDVWHKAQCEYFIEKFGEILGEANKNPADATYGKAQKIINMTFKYLYCFDDAAQYGDRFAPCHMALDSYILDWVRDWYLEQYNQGKTSDKKLKRTGALCLPNWSALNYEETNGVPQYIELQRAIREKVKDEKMVPIEAEFVIWHEYRQKKLQN